MIDSMIDPIIDPRIEPGVPSHESRSLRGAHSRRATWRSSAVARTVRLTVGLTVATGLAACGDGANKPDSGSPGDGGVLQDGSASSDAWNPSFADEVIEGLGSTALVGDFAEMVLTADGRPSITYGFVPAGSARPEIHYAERRVDGSWSAPERVVVPAANEPSTNGTLRGLGLAHVGGRPHVTYLGGNSDGPPVVIADLTDLMLSVKSGSTWTERTLVDTSGEAPADCPGTQNYCNFGNVVGSEAAIAARPGGGFAVAYRDTHGGFSLEDLRRSDIEVYGEGGAFTNSNVDPVSGGGGKTNLLYTASGTLLVVYNREATVTTDSVVGVWSAVFTGSEWQRVKVWDRLSGSKLRLALAPDGAIYLVIDDTADRDLVLATSRDEGATWTTEVVDSVGFTGLHPSVATDADGDPVIAYTYCAPAGDGCATLGPKSEVRVARRKNGQWTTRTVHDGQGFGGVGYFTSVQVLADGKLVVSFQDNRNSDLVFVREE